MGIIVESLIRWAVQRGRLLRLCCMLAIGIVWLLGFVRAEVMEVERF